MPRQLAEIRLFNIGTVMSSDGTDIAMEAASFSLDVDSGTENGVLQGVPTDTTVTFYDVNGQAIMGDIEAPMDYIDINGNEHLVIKDSAGWHISSTALPKPGE
jgi:hypothetical protein